MPNDKRWRIAETRMRRLGHRPDVLIEALHSLTCGCGFMGALGHDSLTSGFVAVCPDCGDVSTLRRTAELELLEVRTAP